MNPVVEPSRQVFLPRLRQVLAWKVGMCVALFVFCVDGAAAFGQFRGGRGRGPRFDEERSVPMWELPADFARDCFSFVRIQYRSTQYRSSYSWWTDFPNADWNFSWRLHQLTSMKVHPDYKVIDVTDPNLRRYPFAIMSGVPAIIMNDEEIQALRKYLLGGGFIIVDDFWGEANWDHFESEVLKRVLPERQWVELPIDHPIFHCVFEVKEKPQIPNVGFAVRNRYTGITWEEEDGKVPHYRGISDDKGRLMMLMCHNTDLGDGWEEEGTDPWFFATFSEPKAYPLGINIVFYVLTH